MGFADIFRAGHPALGLFGGGGDENPWVGHGTNPDPFTGGVDERTAYESRKKAKRIYAPARAALAAQNALLEPTLDLTRRAEFGAADIFGDLGTKYAGLFGEAAPQYLAGYRGADPETSGLLSLLNQDATSLVNRGPSDINADTELQQLIRGSQASRGLAYSPGSSLEELINLDRARDERRMARGRYAGEIEEAGRRYYSPAMLTLLNSYRPPSGNNAGNPTTEDLLSLSLNDTAQRRNQQAAHSAANKQLIGSIVGSVLGAAGGAAGLCWVADELYGVNDWRTHLARAWVRAHHENPFVRLYRRHGKAWAKWLALNPWAKPLVQPIWDAMWKAALPRLNDLTI